jgi:hypothetical protein
VFFLALHVCFGCAKHLEAPGGRCAWYTFGQGEVGGAASCAPCPPVFLSFLAIIHARGASDWYTSPQIVLLMLPYDVQELVSRGVTDPARVSVGGHSYGAFMAGGGMCNCQQLQLHK